MILPDKIILPAKINLPAKIILPDKIILPAKINLPAKIILPAKISILIQQRGVSDGCCQRHHRRLLPRLRERVRVLLLALFELKQPV